MSLHPLVVATPEVTEALAAGRPVVALESTVISHGLPYPRNLEVARGMEAAVRSAGAVPATIAVLGGRLRAGLDDAALERLATSRDVRKCSRRDLPIALAAGCDGATTVAGTMYAAHLAGIRVFATGGIGGVHRGHPFDISADLPELAQTPVTVVCAGAKAILDLPLTLEYLETHGVPVIGYGTDELPSFYTRTSGLRIDRRCDTPAEVAAIVRAQRALGLSTGSLVTVPVPVADELPAAEAEAAIAQALAEADARGVQGKDVTPFLLARVSELTGAKSQRANIALLMNNSRVAAQIAAALAGG
jgi:pseudouridine-5'-phosphate glycosidase